VTTRRFVPPAWLLLAFVPWWLGLPLLLASAAALLATGERLHAQAPWLRNGLRWGLPGVLLAVQRALGGGALAWAMALVGALIGYTLLAGLEAWLDRATPREPIGDRRDWPELALGPVGPDVRIVELQTPHWCEGVCPDPRGGHASWTAGRFVLPDGLMAEGVMPRACFSPDGRWFVACSSRGSVLLDRLAQRVHRLRGWTLCGWHEGPWFARASGPAMAWWEVLDQPGARPSGSAGN
jgi:hypothetical protein